MSGGRNGALRALSEASGLQLVEYRSEHVDDCVSRALAREGIRDHVSLARKLRSDAAARTRFRRSVAVSVSGLFRDPVQFDLLEQELIPPLLEGRRRLSVWSAGCADGSELYSVAIVLERLGALEHAFLLGSDVLEENVALAKRGRYGDVAVAPGLRARVRWERRDLVREGAPGGGFRLVLCRNVAIYLAPEARRSLHATLAGSLAAGGVLLVGRSERLGDPAALGLERAAPHAYRKAA